MRTRSLLIAAMSLASLIHPSLATGPGLGNLTYQPSELFQPVSVIQSPHGHGTATMVNGYLMVIFSSDGGGQSIDGGIDFWDVSDPRNPLLVKRYDDNDTHGLREPHGFAFSSSYPGDYLVVQAIDGIQFWDLSDPLSISLLDYMDLPGIEQGDYTGDWWVFWQAPYVYVAGTGSGLYIVDATDPANPVLVRQVATGEIGGLSPGMTYAVGNLLVLMENQSNDYATMDISDPTDPVLIQNLSGTTGYSHLFAAGMILTSGGNGGPEVMGVHSVGHDGTMNFVGLAGSGLGNGGYGSYQDGVFHSGFSSKYAKIDVGSLTQLGTGSSGLPGRDEDFGEVLGNVVFVGNDHTQGSALVVHQTAPDTNGPDVHWVHPADGAVDQALTSRVGLSMSDNVDIRSIDGSTFLVRPQGGAALSGKYSVQKGLVNFSPDTPLVHGTVYEVVVNGIEDLVGNPGGSFQSSFTTSADPAPSCDLGDLSAAETNALVPFDAVEVSGDLPLTFSWDFGDGTAPTGPAPTSPSSHSYTAPGRYSVLLTVTNPVGSSSCGAVQIVHEPLTPLAPVSSSSILHTGTRSYNVNADNDSVTAIDDATQTFLWEMPVGDHPRTLAQSPGGDLWVVNQDDATISVLDATTGALLDTLPLPFASRPYGVVVRPDKARGYVTLEGTGELLELDATGAVLDSVAVGAKPRGIAVSWDSARIFVTRFISPSTGGEVREVDATTFGVARTFSLQLDPGPDTEASGRGVPNYVTSLRISPDGKRALVPSKKDNIARGIFRDGQPLTFESRTRTIVSELDLVGDAENLAARTDLNDRDMAQTLLFSPLGDLFFVAVQGNNQVMVFDANDRSLVGSLNCGRAPQGLAFNGDGSRLYVHNFMSRSVSIFDTAELIAAASNSAPLIDEITTVGSEALSPDVLLGKRIFYDASDPRMSQDGYISCASCHLDGGEDGRVWDFTQAGEGLRNTITLVGRAGLGHGNVHWTANFDEIQDFENDIRNGFAGIGFLTDPQFAATSDPLGAPKTGLSAELDALAAYVASLDTFPDSPHRNPDGSLTTEGAAGKLLFESMTCSNCHFGLDFTDGARHDVGTIEASSGQGIGLPLAGVGFETPTLKGIWETAPYLHNGQAATLEELLDSAAHGGTDTLSSSDRADLVAYLLQIDGREIPTAFDVDQDGVLTTEDNCPSIANGDQQDTDTDGAGNACDCAPLDPGAFSVPVEIEQLRVEAGGALEWSSANAGDDTVYQLFRETESGMAVGDAPDGVCLESALTTPATVDATVPPLGSAYRYLVRATNPCGTSPWGHNRTTTCP